MCVCVVSHILHLFLQDLSPAAPKLTANEWLRLGSTFHSLYAIAAQVAPVASSGIETLETNGMALRCLQSQTGVKFVLTAVANTPAIQMTTVLQTVYELYTDYVLKVNEDAYVM